MARTISGNVKGGSITNGQLSAGTGTPSNVYLPSGNKAVNGGGVFVNKGAAFAMTDGEISGNNATHGGGAALDEGTSFKMSGGEITRNASTTSGGVLVNKSATFTMSGGSITNNTAANQAGGIFVSGSLVSLSNDTTVTGNVVRGAITDGALSGGTVNNVALLNNALLTVAGELTNVTPIGVTTATAPAADADAQITNARPDGARDKFYVGQGRKSRDYECKRKSLDGLLPDNGGELRNENQLRHGDD